MGRTMRRRGHLRPAARVTPGGPSHPTDAAPMDIVFTQEQHDHAKAWLDEHREEIGLTKARNATRRTDAKKLHEETGGFGYFPGSKRRVKKFSDVSDSEDDTDTELDLSDESELDRERRRVADEFGEKLEKLVRVMLQPEDERTDETCKALYDKHLEQLRMIRTDPQIAPDEPTFFILRPFDVLPGDTSRDHKYVYKYALTTVHDVCRSMAKKLKVPAERLDVVKAGVRIERDKTLMACGVGFGYVLYLRVDKSESVINFDGVYAEGEDGTKVRVSQVKKSEEGGWVVVGKLEEGEDVPRGTDE